MEPVRVEVVVANTSDGRRPYGIQTFAREPRVGETIRFDGEPGDLTVSRVVLVAASTTVAKGIPLVLIEVRR